MYEDTGGHRNAAMLMGLTNPQWSKELTAKQFVDKLDEWETDLDMCEKPTSELIGDSINFAVILKHAPTEVQASLRWQMATIHDEYDALRATVQLLVRGLTECNSRGAPHRGNGDMEVDSTAKQTYSQKHKKQDF